jgi:hypothetical protein
LVKEGTDRATKYANKFDSTVVQRRFDQGKTQATALASAQQTAMAEKARLVRARLNLDGILAINTILYTSYGNKCFGLIKKYESADEGGAAWLSAILEFKTWLNGYKATEATLREVFKIYFGQYPSGYL